MRRLVTLFAIVIFASAFAAVGHPVQAQTGQRCFSETGFCIEGRIREYWEQNGGLSVFGLPLGPQQTETIEGKQLQVQRFERNRLEIHPENARPYDVLLGRLGADRLAQQGRDWQQFAKVGGAPAGCLYFAETGHSVCEPFLSAFRANGLELDGRRGKTLAESIGLFGLPLSEPQVETLSDGKNYTVQWFERARFESHPENAPPYNVLLGLLGSELAAAPPAAAPAPDVCADVPDPVSAAVRPSKCVTAGTTLEIDVFGFRPNEQVGFWITDPNGDTIGTIDTVSIGPTGRVNGLPFDTFDVPAGRYQIVFQGVSSGHQAIVYFKVLAPEGSAPATPGVLPPSQNSTVVPERGPRGTVFAITGRGFIPGEQVGVYATTPDRSVFGAPFQVTADSRGEVFVTFTANPPIDTGIWANTFEGVTSGRKAIAYFEIQP